MIVRRYQPRDESQMLALWNTALWADKISPESFREKVLLDPNIGEDGIFVAEDGGQFLGAAIAFVRSTDLPWGYEGKSRAASDKGFVLPVFPPPACCNDGVGPELLATAEDYLRSRQRTTISICGYYPLFLPDGIDGARYPELHGFLMDSGYHPHDTTYSMGCDLRNHRFAEEPGRSRDRLGEEQITFSHYRPEHLLAVKRFLLGEFPAWISSFVYKVATRSPGHEMSLAIQGDEVVGYCQYNYYGQTERVGPFGVSEKMQGKGVGQGLVAHLLESMAEGGLRFAYFGSTGRRQVKFYEKNGFAVYREKTVFEKL
jgi:ribosomal protein S18 acetylase RimI-like enzyme